MREIFLAVLLLFSTCYSYSQTLFTYGKDFVSVKEFLAAYKKSNTAVGAKNDKEVLDFLDLYITSRLKIKEAKEKGYDTLPEFLSDLENIRTQILTSSLNDVETVEKLTKEAFTRSQKDIRLAHIFVGYTANGRTDTTAVLQKANEAYTKLQKGANFSEIAKKYSNDPSVQQNGGDIGYITVFTLPYELENVAYKITIGKVSPIYKSKAGYHIFKNLGERKSLGRIKAAHILLAVPAGADAGTKAKIQKQADSLYNRVVKGDDFGKLAAQFSNDVVSAASNGLMPEFGVGEFDPIFEKAVFVLKTPGSITKPILTSYGYHIVKLVNKLPVNTNGNNTKATLELKQRVEQNERINVAKMDPKKYNADVEQQINEFKDGNLFFEIMQRQIWSRGQSDSLALQQYYQQHQTKYRWNHSADAIIFQAPNAAAAKNLTDELKKTPQNWRSIINNVNENITLDSGRFEIIQIPNANKLPVKAGSVTSPLINKEDNTASFAYIIKVYDQPAQRSFADAKGLVITDYHTELEKQWIAELRAKYPVKINQKVLKGLLVNKKSKSTP